MYKLEDHNSLCIVNESYFYKTEPYYTILECEDSGIRTIPSSSDVLDAYVVPICLEKARLAGIPVCEWVISNQYVSVPAIVYGLNYFSTPSDYTVVRELDEAKRVIKHVTNHGRYPFCYQKINENSTITECISIMGRTLNCREQMASISKMVFEVFQLPLVEIVMVEDNGNYYLSSLAPVKYSQLSEDETELLQSLLDTKVNHFE